MVFLAKIFSPIIPASAGVDENHGALISVKLDEEPDLSPASTPVVQWAMLVIIDSPAAVYQLPLLPLGDTHPGK
jgi:hypothetical protein